MRGWAERLDRLLTWKRARTYALVLLALLAVAWVDMLALGSPPLNSSGTPIGGDYIAFHAAGRLVLGGEATRLYDHAAISGVQNDLLGGRVPGFYDAYRNPPFFAVLFAPLAALDLLQGFAIFAVLSAGCLALAVWLLLKEAPPLMVQRWRGLVILVLAFPPVYFGLIDGENAVLSLLLYALIYRSFVRRQEGALGVWAALGLFKPQLFFIFPLVFLASRRWRSLASYAATALALLGVSVVLVGGDGMQAWLRVLLEPEAGNATVNSWRMASLKSFFDVLVPGQSIVALVLYAVSSAALVLALLRAWSRRPGGAELPHLWAATALVAVLVDPHLVDYDLTVLISAAVIAAPLMAQARWWIIALYILALFRAELPLGGVAIQLTPLVLVAVTLLAWRRGIVQFPSRAAWVQSLPGRILSPLSRA